MECLIAVTYMIRGRLRAFLMIDCGLCVQFFPQQAIRLVSKVRLGFAWSVKPAITIQIRSVLQYGVFHPAKRGVFMLLIMRKNPE
ncbi:MAG: hypothetical protein L3K24_14910 [Gammaproteobacteria bacterium]|nr:hypothetical protein [Gammaproteobacteria bacterium]